MIILLVNENNKESCYIFAIKLQKTRKIASQTKTAAPLV